MAKMNEIFGSMVFNDQVMRQRLPLNAYEAVQNAIRFDLQGRRCSVAGQQGVFIVGGKKVIR